MEIQVPARRLAAAGAVALALSLVAEPAAATPRHAMRVGQDCNLCHQSPSGGGMRSLYASQYLLPSRLAMTPRGGDGDGGAGSVLPDPQIGQDLAIGADLRTFWMHRDDADAGNNFLQMQGSVYLSFTLGERFSAYLHEEFGQGAASAFEVFGLGWILPAAGYVKAGKFVPPFGWRQADHRSFTRRETVFLPANPPHSDTGVEIGFHPGAFQVQAALTNGEIGSPREANDELAVTARGSWRRSWGPVNVAAGGSWFRHRGLDRRRMAGGPFAGAAWGRVAWTGEADWSRSEIQAGRGLPPVDIYTTFTTSHEVAVEIVQGLDVVGTYDFHDADVDFETGAVARWGAGVEALVSPFVQLRGKVNAFAVDEGPDVFEPDRSRRVFHRPYFEDAVQAQVELHLLY